MLALKESLVLLAFLLGSSAQSLPCNPTLPLTGAAVSVVHKSGKLEWGHGSGLIGGGLKYQAVSKLNTPEFGIEPIPVTGVSPKYKFKAANSVEPMTVIQDTLSKIPVLAWSGSSNGLAFDITCEACPTNGPVGSPIGTGCTISSVDTISGSPVCVRVSTEVIGDNIREYPCEKDDAGKFDLVPRSF